MVSVTDKNTGASSKDHLDVQAWLSTLQVDRTSEELEVIRRACVLAEQVHAGQQRLSGEPYVQHVLSVANILAALRLDAEPIAAALLHDVVEDGGVTKMEMIHSLHGEGKKEQRQAETLRKMLLAMADDVRVVLIKLADRTHNMRTLSALPEDRQRRIAEETLNIYAPLANRLGIWHIKWELEDLAFRYLHPDTYKQIASMLKERRVDRERYINQFMKTLADALARAGSKAEITGRPKHIYSIWRKMSRKNVDYSQIYDVRAVRVLVDEVRDCYAARGVVHGLWQYIAGEFDDYIATPKDNSYRSIHTAVIGPQGRTVEVQIRTHEMHQHSELGVAAHWRYKESVAADAGFDRKVTLLRQLLEWKDDIAQGDDGGDHSEKNEDRVYVFSPMGDIVDLPHGATPLDFAYHIHTELGHRTRGAKVNGHMVTLTFSLQTGQQVELLTIKKGTPSRDWLNPHLGYLKTARARGKVQHWFKQQNVEANVAAGRAAFEKEVQRLGLGAVNFGDVARRLNFTKSDDLFAAIGRGDVKTSQAVHTVQQIHAPVPDKLAELPAPAAAPRREGGGIRIMGVGYLMTQLARCC